MIIVWNFFFAKKLIEQKWWWLSWPLHHWNDPNFDWLIFKVLLKKIRKKNKNHHSWINLKIKRMMSNQNVLHKKCVQTHPLKRETRFKKECSPNFLKTAKILPLYKNGEKNEPDNYRPISLLSCISKLFEKLTFKRLSNFAAKNSLIDKHQFGFRSNHSCTHAILSITDFFRESVDNKKFGDSCFIDLKKHLIQLIGKFCWRNFINMGSEGKFTS